MRGGWWRSQRRFARRRCWRRWIDVIVNERAIGRARASNLRECGGLRGQMLRTPGAGLFVTRRALRKFINAIRITFLITIARLKRRTRSFQNASDVGLRPPGAWKKRMHAVNPARSPRMQRRQYVCRCRSYGTASCSRYPSSGGVTKRRPRTACAPVSCCRRAARKGRSACCRARAWTTSPVPERHAGYHARSSVRPRS